jgi:26S proteasome regulatory subunit N2
MFLSISLSAKALDEYAVIRSRASEATETEQTMDPRLEAIVEKMLDK